MSVFKVLSTTPRPTESSHGNLEELDVLVETDTGAIYEYRGSTAGWVQTHAASGAAHVETQASSTHAYGPYPATYWTDTSATGAAAGTVYTLTDATAYNQHIFNLSALTATSMDIHVSIDGTNFFGPVRLIDLTTNAVFATSAITAVGVYKLEGKFKSVRVVQVGANALTVRIGHGWV